MPVLPDVSVAVIWLAGFSFAISAVKTVIGFVTPEKKPCIECPDVKTAMASVTSLPKAIDSQSKFYHAVDLAHQAQTGVLDRLLEETIKQTDLLRSIARNGKE